MITSILHESLFVYYSGCVKIFVTPTPVLAIVLGIIGGLILLALILLLLWKLLITAYVSDISLEHFCVQWNPSYIRTYSNLIRSKILSSFENSSQSGLYCILGVFFFCNIF